MINKYKEIYLAGGCFWGTQMYFDAIPGVLKTEVGYANGNTKNPTYEDVCHNNTGHAEAVKVLYDPELLTLDRLLSLYYDVIIAIEVEELKNYYPAEEYHQKYLEKNPHGYCHISRKQIENVKNIWR